jgi:dCMP deaminase
MPIARPNRDQYYMGIALAVRRRANCLGSRVGAVLVLEDRVLATGYNGTPAGMPNCDEGGCDRCANRERYGSGRAYDVCICVHAEQNTLLVAARFGIRVQGASIYTTMRPCFGCSKELVQAKIEKVFFLHDWQHPDASVRPEYARIQSAFSGGVHEVAVPTDWSQEPSVVAGFPPDTGHSIPRP